MLMESHTGFSTVSLRYNTVLVSIVCSVLVTGHRNSLALAGVGWNSSYTSSS